MFKNFIVNFAIGIILIGVAIPLFIFEIGTNYDLVYDFTYEERHQCTINQDGYTIYTEIDQYDVFEDPTLAENEVVVKVKSYDSTFKSELVCRDDSIIIDTNRGESNTMKRAFEILNRNLENKKLTLNFHDAMDSVTIYVKNKSEYKTIITDIEHD